MKKKTRILILAANPKDSTRLRLDEEIRDIKEGIHRSKFRDQFEIKTGTAVRSKDIRRLMLRYKPEILHFCGHGEKKGLMVEDESGRAVFLQQEALSGLLELFADSVQCVLLNAGYSQLQAETVSRHIDVVIGMKNQMDRPTGIEFAVGFYDALGAGESFEKAFELGKNAALMKNGVRGHMVPVLYAGQHTVPAAPKPKKVFLCYAHKDKTLYAEPLARGLRHHGVEVWIDEGTIRPGDSLKDRISQGIEDSDYFVVLLTPNSIDSKFVNLELNLAFSQFQNENISIIPAVFGSCVIPGFLSSFPFVDFRKFFGYGLKELLLTMGVESRLLSQSDTHKLLLKMFSSGSAEHIKKYILANENSRTGAVEDLKKENLKYVIFGSAIALLGLSGILTRLLAVISPPLAMASSFGFILWGLQLTTKYFFPKLAITRYFRLLSRFEALISDIEPDIFIKDPGALYYEFLDDNAKRFYRIHRIGSDDLHKSIIICKRRYLKYMLILLAVFIAWEILIRVTGIIRIREVVGISRLAVLGISIFIFSGFKHQVKRIRAMFHLMRDFKILKNPHGMGDLYAAHVRLC
jgi:hypothetical protein